MAGTQKNESISQADALNTEQDFKAKEAEYKDVLKAIEDLIQEKTNEKQIILVEVNHLNEVKATLLKDIEQLRSIKSIQLDGLAGKSDTASTLEEFADQELSIKFTVKSLRHKGVEWKSEDLEKACSEGDPEAMKVVADLIKKKSGVIEIVKPDAKEEGGE